MFNKALMRVTNYELVLTAKWEVLRSALRAAFLHFAHTHFFIKQDPHQLIEFWNFPHFYILKHALLAIFKEKQFFF